MGLVEGRDWNLEWVKRVSGYDDFFVGFEIWVGFWKLYLGFFKGCFFILNYFELRWFYVVSVFKCLVKVSNVGRNIVF